MILREVFGLVRRLGCPGGGEGLSSAPPNLGEEDRSPRSVPAVDDLLDLLSDPDSSDCTELCVAFLLRELSTRFCLTCGISGSPAIFMTSVTL